MPIFGVHPRSNDVSQSATVTNLLLTSYKRHIRKARIDHNPAHHLRNTAQRRSHAPGTLSRWKLFQSYITRLLPSKVIALLRPRITLTCGCLLRRCQHLHQFDQQPRYSTLHPSSLSLLLSHPSTSSVVRKGRPSTLWRA